MNDKPDRDSGYYKCLGCGETKKQTLDNFHKNGTDFEGNFLYKTRCKPCSLKVRKSERKKSNNSTGQRREKGYSAGFRGNGNPVGFCRTAIDLGKRPVGELSVSLARRMIEEGDKWGSSKVITILTLDAAAGIYLSEIAVLEKARHKVIPVTRWKLQRNILADFGDY